MFDHLTRSRPRPATLQFDTVLEREPDGSHEVRQLVLTVLDGPGVGTMRIVGDDPILIGREPGCDLVTPDPAVSGRHLRLFRIGARYFVDDLRSTNGTYRNGVRLTEVQAVADGDRVHIGRTTVLGFRFHGESEIAAMKRLYESSVVDALTGVFNRRHFDERLASEAAFAARHHTLLSLLLLDVDHFKRVNDTLGHPAGDAVLRALGQSLRTQVRAEDVACRYGGEEFAVLARGIDAEAAAAFGERLRACIERTPVELPEKPLRITVSVGVATASGGNALPTDRLVAAADRALYACKESGRNRVRSFRLDD